MPPVGQQLVYFAHIGAQAHEVKGGAKTRLLGQAERCAAHAFLKARLHHPNFAHVGGELAATRYITNAGIEHVVDGILQGRMPMLALQGALGPAVAHIGPEHTGQQKTRRHGLALAHPAVGVLESRVDKGLSDPLDHHVEQRVDAARQAQQLELIDGSQRMPGLQQLEHFIEQAALWNFGQQRL